MFLFLIELFILGFAISNYFAGKLPNFLLAVSSILIGYVVYFLNGFLLVLIGVPLRSTPMIVMVSIELIAVILHQTLSGKFKQGFKRSLWVNFAIVAIAYFGILLFFYFNNYFFATNDSVYLVVMAKSLIQSGFSQWYFSSPKGMGLFIPYLQTIGMLFGLEYTWFIQPVFMAVFIALFFFFSWRGIKRFIASKLVRWLLLGSVIIFYISTDLIFIMTTYIHTNFDTGLFLFIIFCLIYFGIEEENHVWFYFVPIFMIGFGALRTENLVVALILILIYMGTQRIPSKVLRWMFLPYLAFQFILNLSILLMHPDTFSDQLSDGLLVLTLIGIAVVALLLFLTELNLVKKVFLPRIYWLIPVGLLISLLGLGVFNFDQLVLNINVSLTNFFTAGNWDSFWWIVLILFAVLPNYKKIPQKREIISFILSFIILIQVLGMLRHPYHIKWSDSANRMLIHVAPIILYYLITKVAMLGSNKSPKSENLDFTA